LFSLLKEHIDGKTLLDFSPSRALYRAFKNTQGIEYIATDYSNEFLSDKKLDITCIKEPDESFDLVLCYHVLEHIENDRQAIEELYRILKTGGECWIQTPFKEGQVYENPAITDPQQRLIHFGQADHVRIYSVNGLKERLEAAGFYVTVNEYKAEPKYGFDDEIILIAKK
jgi:ubiquinone/menaquinone biosynthesis C-methylase UbiE